MESRPASPGARADGSSVPQFVPPPERGRVFAAARIVRVTDATPSGRLRFDAFARYLQEVAEDDVADAGWDAPYTWLLRRCVIVVRAYPRSGDRVRLQTFCTGTGPRWAERTTTLSGTGGDLMQATGLWVAITRDTGNPTALGPEFHRYYGEATGGRQVSARLRHPGPDGSEPGRAWPVRAADFDPAGHVNNSVHWAAIEDVLAGLDWLPTSAELEYHRPILPADSPCLLTSAAGDHVRAWLVNGTRRLASAVLARSGACGPPAEGPFPLTNATP